MCVSNYASYLRNSCCVSSFSVGHPLCRVGDRVFALSVRLPVRQQYGFKVSTASGSSSALFNVFVCSAAQTALESGCTRLVCLMRVSLGLSNSRIGYSCASFPTSLLLYYLSSPRPVTVYAPYMTMSSGSIFSQNIMRITRTRHVWKTSKRRHKSPTLRNQLGAILSAAMYCSYIKSDFGTCAPCPVRLVNFCSQHCSLPLPLPSHSLRHRLHSV